MELVKHSELSCTAWWALSLAGSSHVPSNLKFPGNGTWCDEWDRQTLGSSLCERDVGSIPFICVSLVPLVSCIWLDFSWYTFTLLSGNKAEEPVSLHLPDNVVKGSARASISISGKWFLLWAHWWARFNLVVVSGRPFDMKLLKREYTVFIFFARFPNTRLSDFWIST